MNEDHIETVTLVKERFTVTIEPTPEDATVTLTSAGETQSGNAIEVDYGSNVAYTVSKEGYITVSDSVTNVDQDATITVALEEAQPDDPGRQPDDPGEQPDDPGRQPDD